jgi:hypothetical protein
MLAQAWALQLAAVCCLPTQVTLLEAMIDQYLQMRPVSSRLSRPLL